MQKYSTDQFHYQHKRFQTEASSLAIPPELVLTAFEMVSARTGTVLKFNYHGVQRSADGDVNYWTYKSEPRPDIGQQIAIIFND